MFEDDEIQFGNFEQFENQPVVRETPEISVVPKPRLRRNVIVHRSGIRRVPNYFCSTLLGLGVAAERVVLVRQFLVMGIFGKRNLEKRSVEETRLSECEKYVMEHVRDKMQNPSRRTRILGFLESDITKRLIHFFVVHYVALYKEVAYWLDKREYPYRIIGDFNQYEQRGILDAVARKEHIVWINIHHQYRICRFQHNPLLHAPSTRSVLVSNVTDTKQEFSLVELNFYLWFDEIGGFAAFEHFRDDVIDKKRVSDQNKRRRIDIVKRKIAVKNIEGRNHRAFLVQSSIPESFDGRIHKRSQPNNS